MELELEDPNPTFTAGIDRSDDREVVLLKKEMLESQLRHELQRAQVERDSEIEKTKRALVKLEDKDKEILLVEAKNGDPMVMKRLDNDKDVALLVTKHKTFRLIALAAFTLGMTSLIILFLMLL